MSKVKVNFRPELDFINKDDSDDSFNPFQTQLVNALRRSDTAKNAMEAAALQGILSEGERPGFCH
mgnify:CR=1 FL=1